MTVSYFDVAMFARALLKKDEPKAKNPSGHECQMRCLLVQYLLERNNVRAELVGVSKRATEVHFVVKTDDGVYIDASPDTSTDFKAFFPAIVSRPGTPEYSLYERMEQNARGYTWARAEQRKIRPFWRVLFDDFDRIKREYSEILDDFVCHGLDALDHDE